MRSAKSHILCFYSLSLFSPLYPLAISIRWLLANPLGAMATHMLNSSPSEMNYYVTPAPPYYIPHHSAMATALPIPGVQPSTWRCCPAQVTWKYLPPPLLVFWVPGRWCVIPPPGLSKESLLKLLLPIFSHLSSVFLPSYISPEWGVCIVREGTWASETRE